MKRCFRLLTRRKDIKEEVSRSELNRVLTLCELTTLGVGSTLGLGAYVLAGSVAQAVAGPSTTISFLIAGFSTAIAAICYAEFGCRVPRAGSAYVFCYVTVGEFIAFQIGSSLILSYVIGTAANSRGLTAYIDSLIGGKIANFQSNIIQFDMPFLAAYPDFVSFFIICILTAILAYGVQESSYVIVFCTTINMLTLALVIITGALNAKPSHWFIDKKDIPEGYEAGEGGFIPFGIVGIMTGAAKCFYAFVGFDGIATAGEEALNPRRNIPLAIVFCILICSIAYLSISMVLTMMVPYYTLNPDAPLPYAFEKIGWHAVKWCVTIGAVFAIWSSLLGAIFPLPRIFYAMANDGIIFECLSYVNSWTKTPLQATFLAGLLSGGMALAFSLHQLIDMMSIGTLLAYTLVTMSCVILRYRSANENEPSMDIDTKAFFKQMFNSNSLSQPNYISSVVANTFILIYTILITILSMYIQLTEVSLDNILSVIIVSVLCVLILITIIIMHLQPPNLPDLSVRVPLVPIFPFFGMFINIYLMFQLDLYTWLRFIFWVLIGSAMYFAYGVKHSHIRT